MKNRILGAASLFGPLATSSWDVAGQTSIDPADIRQPWRTGYGFPLTAVQLAANHNLLLHCREDEVFELMAGLNELLADPAALNRAYTWLQQLEQDTRASLAQLRRIEAQPVSQAEIPELVAYAEQLLTEPVPPHTPIDRLESLLLPGRPAGQMAGLMQILWRFQVWLPALEKIKDRGFRAVVFDRRRQAARPALEARRNETIGQDEQPGRLKAGFLLPTRYHLTLWAYLVCRSDAGQASVWN
jgi:hypothetical protein